MFKHRLVSHEEVDKIRELGFNVACIYLGYEITEDILNYCMEKGLYLLIPQFIALPTGVQYTWDVPEWRGHRGPTAIRRGIVEAYAKHPAVIGWYLGDEIEPSFIHHLKQLNHDCHELSPGLMTWHAGFYHDILPLYYDCADVFGYDFYPIARAVVSGGPLLRSRAGVADRECGALAAARSVRGLAADHGGLVVGGDPRRVADIGRDRDAGRRGEQALERAFRGAVAADRGGVRRVAVRGTHVHHLADRRTSALLRRGDDHRGN